MTTFRKGDKVHVLDHTPEGEFFVEGQATVIEPVEDVEGLYIVDFGDSHGPVDRFLDPGAQADPEAFVAKLNSGGKES